MMHARSNEALRDAHDPRWYLVGLVTAAIAISYFDRQTISVAITAIERSISISDRQFSYLQSAFLIAYAALYAIGGRLLDHLGTRRGFLLIMLWWSMACALHGFASTFAWLLAMRFLLGMGEGGAFPAAARVVSEWLPPEERATAMGLINAGTAVGSLLAPPLIGLLLIYSGWRTVFFAAGGTGLLWVLWWGIAYRDKRPALTISKGDTIDARLSGQLLSFRSIVGMRRVQTLVFAKFMSDSAWFFLLFWLPKYLYDARGFDVKQVSYYAWIPYAASGAGSFLGGWLSSRVLRSGHSLDFSRKLVLGINAAMMPVVILAPLVPVHYALALFSIAFFAQQSWSGLIMTIPADVFPLEAVGTVSGLVGFGGSIGGAIFGLIAGALLQHGFGYNLLFALAGTFHLVGFLVFVTLGGTIEPLQLNGLKEIENPL
ncbi:MAG: MFS transporter [Terracidiphilus sp.]|jgi:ACS family hexuronate transporter-like MFS transporter